MNNSKSDNYETPERKREKIIIKKATKIYRDSFDCLGTPGVSFQNALLYARAALVGRGEKAIDGYLNNTTHSQKA